MCGLNTIRNTIYLAKFYSYNYFIGINYNTAYKMTFYDLNMNNKRITDCQDPSGNQDVATKNYIDSGFKANKIYVGNATATVANKVYYLNSSSDWILADKTNSAGKMIAVAVGGNSLTNGMWSGSNPADLAISVAGDIGSTLFLDVNGNFTTTQPSGSDLTQVRPCGYKVSSTNIIFYTSNNYIMPAGLGQYGIASGAGSTGYSSSSISVSSVNYQLLKWTSTTGTNTMNVATAGVFDVFILGAGGGAGINGNSGSGGGGGAGQLLKMTAYLEVGTYTIVIGAGGALGVAGGGTGTRSAFRGGFSGIFPTSPAYPKIMAVGGGGGMASSAGGGNTALNSYARCTWATQGACGGGGASPQTETNETVTYSAFSPTNISSLNAWTGDNTLTTGGFYGGIGYNNSNYSATGGGGGLGGAGGDYTQTGDQSTKRGGIGGLGVLDNFDGVTKGFGGGGAGGQATQQAQQVNTNGSIIEFSISGTTLTLISFAVGSAVGVGYRLVAMWGGTDVGFQNVPASPNNATTPIVSGANNPITSEIFIVSQISGTPNGVGTYQLNQTFSPSMVNSGTGSTITATRLLINQYGNGMGGRNIDSGLGYYWSGSPAGYNSGSGGGGGANQNWTGGRGGIGGSGLVMVRYRI
jgi:hypothetical protein